MKGFICVFKQRLVDMYIQEWSGVLRDKDRYDVYRSFKVMFEKEKYIFDSTIYCFRVALSQIRFNVLPLNNNMHRYSADILKRRCPFCLNAPDNEQHFLFNCSMYNDLRSTFLHNIVNFANDFDAAM